MNIAPLVPYLFVGSFFSLLLLALLAGSSDGEFSGLADG
jgi:hypothetical protein